MSQSQGLNFLLDVNSRKSIRTLILFAYFAIFQTLILVQKPFLQLEFIFIFYSTFIFLFVHHFILHFYTMIEKSDLYRFCSYLFDFTIMIYFMKSFPQLSSFLLVLQLFMLFVASFELSFVSLCGLGFLASVGTSIINLSASQGSSVQSLLSLTLFNLSYLSVIVIAGQLRSDISNLQVDLSQTRKKWKSQAEFSKTLVEKMPLGLLVTQSNDSVVLQNSYLSDSVKLQFPRIKAMLDEQSAMGVQSPDLSYLDLISNERKILQVDRSKYYDEDIADELSVFLIKDVTDLRQLENELKQKDKLATIGQLAAGIAHEIRNPLAGISGSIQLLSQDDEKTDPDQKKLMKIVLKEIDRLNNLITEFLDYAKPEKKPDQTINLNELVNEIAHILKAHPEARANLKWNLDISVQKIKGFPEKLKQAILNITINSLQAIKEVADPVIAISLTNDGKNVILSIKDNGSGISAETQKRMFDPFHTTKPKGTGLGLAITHKILDAHAAVILVSSEVGHGTEFKIKFPAIG
ncbi:MAG: hypothetical protein H7328_03040 [Bdellovibrio sp.]|nr:hypothetical protein [Bdellovibrio sp.]